MLRLYKCTIKTYQLTTITLADAGFKERGGCSGGGDQEKGEGAGGGCAPSRAKRGSF